jgi:hypothetical protein
MSAPIAAREPAPPPGSGFGSTTFRSLRYYNARLFFVGLLVSNVGTWMHLTVMSILVFRLTGEASKVGFAIAFQFAPMLFLGAYAGAMADRLNKRKMAIITQSAIGGKIISRETVKAKRKDVTAKCYGGDITRKRKLLEKQKEGKKKMKSIGRVEVPGNVFIDALKLD